MANPLTMEHIDKQTNTKNFVDIEKILRQKTPTVYPWIPKFAITYLKKIAHEEEINEFLNKYGHLEGSDFVDEATNYLNINAQYEWNNKINHIHKYIFVSNHPIGGTEALLLMQILYRKFGTVKVLANDLLMNIKQLSPFFIPINKHGQNSRETVKQINESFEHMHPFLIFPSGMASRKIDGKIQDLPWKKTFVVKAIKHKRDVVPVYCHGRLSQFFYSLAHFRKMVGMKTNLEMLFLGDETFKQKSTTIQMTFGTPISYQTFTPDKTPTEWAQLVRSYVYALNIQATMSFAEFLATKKEPTLKT